MERLKVPPKTSRSRSSSSGFSPSFDKTPLEYSLPPTPPVTSEESFFSTPEPQPTNKIVVLTRATRFLPTHILNTLLRQEYVVRGVVFCGEMELNAPEVEALFDIHPLTRKYLFMHRVTPLDQKDWERALSSANYVVHMVTPLTFRSSMEERADVIYPALEITRNVLRACVKVKSIQRLVLITSTASVAWSKDKTDKTDFYDETVWEDEVKLSGYAKCQLACEKAAWEFVNCLPESDKIELVVLNPAFVMGPVIQGRPTRALNIIKALMESTFPWLPSTTIPLVDVRDVANAVAVALVKPEAVGHRHILYCKTIWLGEIAAILEQEFTRQGYQVLPRERITESGTGCLSCTKEDPPKDLSLLKEFMTRPVCYDNSRMREVLNIDPPHFPEETIIETAYSLIFWGIVKRRKASLIGKSMMSCFWMDSSHKPKIFPKTSSHHV